MRSRPLVIVLTGPTASGKSSVAKYWSRFGPRVWDVDRIAHELYRPGTPLWHAILKTFGRVRCRIRPDRRPLRPEDWLDLRTGRTAASWPPLADRAGRIRRPALGALVFGEARNLARLNRLVHPLLRRELDRRLVLGPQDNRPVVLDMAVYPEPAFRGLGHAVVGVGAPVRARLARLQRHGLTATAARQRLRAQRPARDYRRAADLWLDNHGSPGELRRAAGRLYPWAVALARARSAHP